MFNGIHGAHSPASTTVTMYFTKLHLTNTFTQLQQLCDVMFQVVDWILHTSILYWANEVPNSHVQHDNGYTWETMETQWIVNNGHNDTVVIMHDRIVMMQHISDVQDVALCLCAVCMYFVTTCVVLVFIVYTNLLAFYF